MLMPDVREILDDPEVGGGQAFQVRRKTEKRVRGGLQTTEEIFDATGNIQPEEKGNQSSTTEDLQTESIVVYSTFLFDIGINPGGAAFRQTDEVLYDGKAYRVTRVENWQKWGFTVAHATHDMGG